MSIAIVFPRCQLKHKWLRELRRLAHENSQSTCHSSTKRPDIKLHHTLSKVSICLKAETKMTSTSDITEQQKNKTEFQEKKPFIGKHASTLLLLYKSILPHFLFFIQFCFNLKENIFRIRWITFGFLMQTRTDPTLTISLICASVFVWMWSRHIRMSCSFCIFSNSRSSTEPSKTNKTDLLFFARARPKHNDKWQKKISKVESYRYVAGTILTKVLTRHLSSVFTGKNSNFRAPHEKIKLKQKRYKIIARTEQQEA